MWQHYQLDAQQHLAYKLGTSVIRVYRQRYQRYIIKLTAFQLLEGSRNACCISTATLSARFILLAVVFLRKLFAAARVMLRGGGIGTGGVAPKTCARDSQIGTSWHAKMFESWPSSTRDDGASQCSCCHVVQSAIGLCLSCAFSVKSTFFLKLSRGRVQHQESRYFSFI